MKVFICFVGIKRFECDIFKIRSLSHGMSFQLVEKSTFSQVDDKRW